jgi:hypothetical protein
VHPSKAQGAATGSGCRFSAQGAATGSERSYVLRAGDLVELVIIAADHQDR